MLCQGGLFLRDHANPDWQGSHCETANRHSQRVWRLILLPAWFPDWRGDAIAIVASGPSTKRANVASLRGRLKIIAIKENVELCPWADVVYGCDAAFWRNAMGLPNFRGLKIAYRSPSSLVHSIRIAEKQHRILTAEPGVIGSGGNSGFQALNLAIQFGATRILLIGFDMSDRHGVHWYGRSQGDGRTQPAEWNFVPWRKAFHVAACQMAGLGVQVLNASPLTTLTCFPIVTVENALKEWRL